MAAPLDRVLLAAARARRQGALAECAHQVHFQAAVVAVAVVAALCQLQPCAGASILAVFPHDGRSHWIVFRELLLELADRGHRLTVLTRFTEDAHPSWDLVPLKARMGSDEDFDPLQFGALSSLEEFMILFDVGTAFCRKLMADEGVQRLIGLPAGHFDLVIVETFFHDCLLALGHRQGAPVVGACALGGGPSWVGHLVGAPYPLSYLPEKTFPYASPMSFVERAHNALSSLRLRLHRHFVYLPALDEIVRRGFGAPSVPPLAQLERNVSLLLLNSHFSFDHPRPLPPNAVEVAGMHIKPPGKLPQDLQSWMDGARDGVVFFSMGSGIKSSNLPRGVQEAFLKVFSRLRQRVLWKYEKDSLPNQPDNLRIAKWFPQNDLLAHQNMRLFVSHGGAMSVQEALHWGVPLLGLPVFGDQEANLVRAQEAGYAILLPLRNATERAVAWAVDQLLNNPRFLESARRHSRLFRDRPRPPLQTAVYWVEYVARHGGAPHLRSAAQELAWFQLLLLDVTACPLLCAAAALLALKVLLRRK